MTVEKEHTFFQHQASKKALQVIELKAGLPYASAGGPTHAARDIVALFAIRE